jgi:hypothetical protein
MELITSRLSASESIAALIYRPDWPGRKAPPKTHSEKKEAVHPVGKASIGIAQLLGEITEKSTCLAAPLNRVFHHSVNHEFDFMQGVRVLNFDTVEVDLMPVNGMRDGRVGNLFLIVEVVE